MEELHHSGGMNENIDRHKNKNHKDLPQHCFRHFPELGITGPAEGWIPQEGFIFKTIPGSRVRGDGIAFFTLLSL
jgi:hypothetical protein